jgi:hypothetical protein
MRTQALSAVKAGITRLRDKGGASPDSLYDLKNGYVTAARTIRARPGTRIHRTLPAGTKGLVYFRGEFVVFANEPMVTTDLGFSVEVLKHPSDSAATLQEIHFAAPFLGYLYVAAEFTNGDVFHFWLEKGEPWQAGKTYLPGAMVTPTTPNGLAYRLQSGTGAYTPWAANVARNMGDVVVPTTDNGYKYTVTETTGDGSRSGTTEPTWPTTAGETVYEDANIENPLGGNESTTAAPTVPTSVSDRYGTGNQAGTT